MSPRPPKFRFYLDENIPTYVGVFLRSLGHSILATQRGLKDVAQLTYATKGKAIFLTYDQDFKHYTSSGIRVDNSSGVVVFLTANPSAKQYERMVRKLLKAFEKRNPKGKLWIVSVDKVRIL